MQTQANEEINSSTGLDKIKQYKWRLQDEPGRLQWIPKRQLRVDSTYQRNASESRALTLAKDWSWLACGVIIVAQREANPSVFYVVDGQHRTLGAMKRSDVDKLPCIVFRTDSTTDEALGFLRANTNRRAITGIERFNPMIATGDPSALLVQRLIESSGRIVSQTTGPTTVRCVRLLMTHASRDAERLERVWPVIAEVCRGFPLHERMVDSLMYIDSHLEDERQITEPDIWQRVVKIGYERLMGAAVRMASAYTQGGAKVWATGMVEELNRGRRRRLSLSGISND